MKIGMIGVGRLRANTARRFRSAGGDLILRDVDGDTLASVKGECFATTAIFEELNAGERLVVYRSRL